MNPLKEKYLNFKELDRYKFTYLLEDGRKVSFVVYKKHFPHLIGLHKLIDIPLISASLSGSNFSTFNFKI